jgi:hypothetical protein
MTASNKNSFIKTPFLKDKGVKSFVDSQTQDLSAFFAAMTEKNSKSFVARVLAPKVEDNIGESGTAFEMPSLKN